MKRENKKKSAVPASRSPLAARHGEARSARDRVVGNGTNDDH